MGDESIRIRTEIRISPTRLRADVNGRRVGANEGFMSSSTFSNDSGAGASGIFPLDFSDHKLQIIG